MFTPAVGTIVTLSIPSLGNPAGTRGVCYLRFVTGENLWARPAWAFVFQNGNYAGFSRAEVSEMLTQVGYDAVLMNYRFKDVGQLDQDFRNGIFDEALGR